MLIRFNWTKCQSRFDHKTRFHCNLRIHKNTKKCWRENRTFIFYPKHQSWPSLLCNTPRERDLPSPWPDWVEDDVKIPRFRIESLFITRPRQRLCFQCLTYLSVCLSVSNIIQKCYGQIFSFFFRYFKEISEMKKETTD